ncbi:hypothetical protein SISSUDRAFT_609468 [Sistotremastrum suecicum HHB10207 ss-3]|uniref:CUE domain-containing protein n=1 Tax=Sistotremastrum suecicum HHB10207 ss-3 TaxID=1314776 RepID=A0A166IC30_9AGAM|nr:hypothetical protein SISSUDRAFT_609468 [Sistotremastrum suecicum HHB10207 ss-3]
MSSDQPPPDTRAEHDVSAADDDATVGTTLPSSDATSNATAHPSTPADASHPSPHTNAPVDPKIASLVAMFPDFDHAVLESVLDSVGGDQDRAIDLLLGMNDPTYAPEHSEVQAPALSQTELDEQFARQLMLQESGGAEPWAAQQRGQSPLPYQPRQPRNRQSQQTTQSGGDTIAELQDQFSKITESGKKTFNNLFSKVRAKIDEFDNKQSSRSQGANTQQWAGQSSSYYSPTTAPTPANSTIGYDASDVWSTQSPVAASPSIPPVPEGRTNLPSSNIPSNVPEPSSGPPELPRAATRTPPVGGIDSSKIGLLPKRPVSLVGTQQTRHDDDDEDDCRFFTASKLSATLIGLEPCVYSRLCREPI